MRKAQITIGGAPSYASFWRRVGMLTCVFAVVLVFSATQATAQSDPFAAYHHDLTAAADALLAQPQAAPKPAASAVPPATPVVPPSRALARVQALRPVVEPILRQAGIPASIAAVMLVESAGRTDALSPAGARGAWQLMPDTARRYGLTVTATRDDRLDLLLSTRAAAAYLRDLFAQFGDWQLAFAAYNAGEKAVASAIVRSGTPEFNAISQRLPRETQVYVPAVLKAFTLFSTGTITAPAAPRGRIVFAETKP